MGKSVPNSKNSYLELRTITDAVYADSLGKSEAFKQAYAVLSKYGIRLRDKDGTNPVMTLSPPDDNTLVMGVRYVKVGGGNTEDHFLFSRDTDLYRCKGKELERILPQYKGSHELQLPKSA